MAGVIEQLRIMKSLAEDMVGISERQAEVDEKQVAIAERGVAVLQQAATVLPVGDRTGEPLGIARFARLKPISSGGGGGEGSGGGSSRIPTGTPASNATSRGTGGDGGGSSRIPTGGSSTQPDPGSQQVTRAIGGLRADVVRGNDSVAVGLNRLARALERIDSHSLDLRGEGLL
jgi:hypothetical protein